MHDLLKDLTPEERKELRADPRQQPGWDAYDDELKAMLLQRYEEFNSDNQPAEPDLKEQMTIQKAFDKARAELHEARRKAGLTQADMAHKMGVSQSTLARLEGKNGNPSLKTLIKMAHALGVSVKIG